MLLNQSIPVIHPVRSIRLMKTIITIDIQKVNCNDRDRLTGYRSISAVWSVDLVSMTIEL